MAYEYNHLDLFAGIGGFGLAAQNSELGIEGHYVSEVEPYAVKLLRQRFPDSVQLGDIKAIDCGKLPNDRPWLVSGGFPCQDISSAGKGKGIDGERSGLWGEMFRLIRELRPRWSLIENVRSLSSKGLDRVLSDLADVGLDAEWCPVQAHQVGLPHNRARLWIVAHAPGDGLGNPAQLFAKGRDVGDGEEPHGPPDPVQFLVDWQRSFAESHEGTICPAPVIPRTLDGLPARLDRTRGLGKRHRPPPSQSESSTDSPS